MTRLLALPIVALFASTAMAATLPSDQVPPTQTQQAQDSANGSMTNTDLSGNVNEDTSQLNTGTTSGTTSGAIIDQTSKRKAKKKKHKAVKETTESTESNMSASPEQSDAQPMNSDD